jgi:hypothetical protein
MGLFLIRGRWPKILPQNSKGAGLAECLIFQSLLARLGLGFRGNKLTISLHYLAQGEGQRGRLGSLPLG